MNGENLKHKPVLLEEVLSVIKPKAGEVYFDTTFGWGGYTAKILDSCACKVIAIDQDPSTKKQANEFKKKYGERFEFIQSKFSQISNVLQKLDIKKVDGFMFDIGVSSMQLDNPERGFSFNKDGPLDMRMSSDGLTAAEFIKSIDESELADILYNYGDERKSRRIARYICQSRSESNIDTTLQLASIVEKANPKKHNHKKHSATKTFQAIRIFINDELRELFNGLSAAEESLNVNGKICVVTFHSTEDKIVKNYFNKSSGSDPSNYKNLPTSKNESSHSLIPFKKAIKPTDNEISENTRSRSAKLRWAKKTDAKPNKFTLDDIGFKELN